MTKALNSNADHFEPQTILLLALPDVLQITEFRIQPGPRLPPTVKNNRPYCNYAAAWWDLLTLQRRLVQLDQSIHVLPNHHGTIDAIRDVLDILEGQLVYPRSKMISLLGRIGRRSRHYPRLDRWVADSKNHENDTLADKVRWLMETTAFGETPGGAVARLFASVEKCLKQLPHERTPPVHRQLPLRIKSYATWNKMQRFCAGLETVHARLLREGAWNCTCPANHQAYLFAVDFCRPAAPGFVASSVICGDSTCRYSQLDFHCTEAIDEATYSTLCADLQTVARSTPWYVVRDQRECLRPVKFRSLLGDWAKPPSVTDRLFLALMLSCLYLHLSGGVWWPYNRTGPLHHTDPGIWFTRHVRVKRNKNTPFSHATRYVNLKVNPPFFPFGGHGSDTPEGARSTDSGVYTHWNKCMPSLPVFGKMLLEILTWKTCSWDDVGKTLDSIETDGEIPHHDYVQSAIRMCTQASDLRPQDSSRSIRKDQELRMSFTDNVISVFQYILEDAFKLGMETLFAETGGTRDADLLISPCSTDHSPTGSIREDGSENATGLSEQPPTVHTTKECMPGKAVLNDDTCWLEKLDKEVIQETTTFMRELQSFQKLLDRRSARPIKVVVLDTGIDLPDGVPRWLKDTRIQSYTWQGIADNSDDNNQHPRRQTGDPDGRDPDGHGTHMASIILDIARNCELYAVQIAGARKDMRGLEANNEVAANIARSIRCAVDTWKADIICMSCGFEASIPRVKTEIDYAYGHEALVIAAAGNTGASGGRRWPAYDNNVLGIYAATGYGNKYDKNPTPASNRTKFALLGCAVEGYVRAVDSPKAKKVRRSGTSHATAVATAVAAISMQILRDCEEDFNENEGARRKYERTERSLRTKPGMEELFSHMTAMDPARDGYDFVQPWRIVPATGESRKALHVAHNIVTWCHNVS